MSVYTIDFTVGLQQVTPSEPQVAGVTGDHKAAVLRFAVPFDGYRYRIEIADGGGGYDITDLLTVKDGKVTYAVPSSWTAAGLATLRLVGVETDANGRETVRFHSAPAYVWFEDRENGEALGASARPAWQETLDSAQFFLENLSQRVQAGEFKGDKGDKGDQGDVSLVDEIEFVMDGGDAGGDVDIVQADFVVEQGADGAWTYRKWQSGLVELWGSTTVNTAFTTKVGENYYAGTAFLQTAYPFRLYGPYNVQFSLYYVGANYIGYSIAGWHSDTTATPKYVPYSFWERTDAVDVTGRYYVTARWKE